MFPIARLCLNYKVSFSLKREFTKQNDATKILEAAAFLI